MTKVINKAIWTDLFKQAGISEQQMHAWHRVFEQQQPELHQAFLEWLGVTPEAIRQIRQQLAE